MGGEYHGYSADITCTFPANGKYIFHIFFFPLILKTLNRMSQKVFREFLNLIFLKWPINKRRNKKFNLVFSLVQNKINIRLQQKVCHGNFDFLNPGSLITKRWFTMLS